MNFMDLDRNSDEDDAIGSDDGQKTNESYMDNTSDKSILDDNGDNDDFPEGNLTCEDITCDPETQYYAHPERCDGFCQCSNGQPIEMDCPSGLEFNRRTNVCDWPDNANCSIQN
jgi:hypothetical protein